jgi:choline dehydrogenase-like flavoprotein
MSTARSKPGKAERKTQHRAEQQERDRARAQEIIVARRRRIAMRGGGLIVAMLAMAGAVSYALHGTSSVSTPALAVDLGKPNSALASPLTSGFMKVGAPLFRNGKPEVLFIGAQYCPHCAGQRWPVVKALSQFGTFSHLRSTASSEGNIPTFDLTHATYTSRFIAFDHKDVEDSNHNPLQTLTSAEQTLFSRYDPTGSIPLVLAGGYAVSGDAYNLADIQGLSFAQVQRALHQGNSTQIVADINAEVNALTTFLCRTDGMKPASVCDRRTIRTIVRTLHA